MESDSSDSSLSDSGLSADSSRSSSLEGKTTTIAAPKETPIEREIRRSIERERSLRRSRGLPNVTPPEYVEIPLRNAVLHQSVATYADRSQGKDRQLAGNTMLYEIHGEFKREKDLVDSGTIQSFYEKGVADQLKERKQLFEAFQTPREYKKRASAIYTVSNFDNLKGMSLHGSEPNVSYVTKSQWQGENSPRRDDSSYLISLGSGPLDTIDSKVVIHETQERVPSPKTYHTKTKTQSIIVVDSGKPGKSSKKVRRRRVRASEQSKEVRGAEVSVRENPFFKLRSAATVVKVQQDIRESQEREKELRKQRISLYSSKESALRGLSVSSATKEEGRSRLSSTSSSSSPSSSDSDSSSDLSPKRITGPPAGMWFKRLNLIGTADVSECSLWINLYVHWVKLFSTQVSVGCMFEWLLTSQILEGILIRGIFLLVLCTVKNFSRSHFCPVVDTIPTRELKAV